MNIDSLFLSITAYAPVIPSDENAMGSVSVLVFYVTVAIAASFICSICEAVLLSSSHSHIEIMAQQGKRAGLIMQRLKANVEQPIAAILTLNTVAHTVGAASAGAEAAAVFGNEYVGVISAVLTLLILILSEIIPKTIGANYWKQLMPFTAYFTQGLVIILYPAVYAFQRLNHFMTPTGESFTVTRSELEMLAQIGAGEGTLKETENRIFKNLLHLGNVMVTDIMTPRTVMLALQQDMTVSEVLAEHPAIPYSRIPIFAETPDYITGFVLRHDIMQAGAEDQVNMQLLQMVRELHSVPETTTVAQVLDAFISQKQHIFLVFDEYGGTAGIITMEDAIESLLGTEITDESDLAADLREMARQRYMRHRKVLGLPDEDIT